jgi:hypothetical protein
MIMTDGVFYRGCTLLGAGRRQLIVHGVQHRGVRSMSPGSAAMQQAPADSEAPFPTSQHDRRRRRERPSVAVASRPGRCARLEATSVSKRARARPRGHTPRQVMVRRLTRRRYQCEGGDSTGAPELSARGCGIGRRPVEHDQSTTARRIKGNSLMTVMLSVTRKILRRGAWFDGVS